MSWLPMPELKRLKDVVVTMDTEANHIYQHKKTALEAGEESVVRQVGEGKDIMSILCELPTSLPFLPGIQCLSFSTCKSGGIGRGPSS